MPAVPDEWQLSAPEAPAVATPGLRLLSFKGLTLLIVLIATGIGILSTGLGASTPVEPASQFGGASPGTITFFYPASSLPPGRTAAMRRSSKFAKDWLLLLIVMLAGAWALRPLVLRGCATKAVPNGRPLVRDRAPLRRGPPAFA